MPLQMIRNNIANVKADIIVCPCNQNPDSIGGAQKAVYEAAGEALYHARQSIGWMKAAEEQATPAFGLPAEYVFHVATPAYIDGKHAEERQLKKCYRNALAKASAYKCTSIAFPLLSSGTYGYPKEEAFEIARNEILKYPGINDVDVILVLFDPESYHISLKRKQDIESYINDRKVNQILEHEYRKPSAIFEEAMSSYADRPKAGNAYHSEKRRKLEDILFRQTETFQEMLLRMIDEKGYLDTEVYKKANIDRKLFSKIRSNRNYHPKKETILAISFSLELTKDETEDLLRRAGYALSPSSKMDLIVSYCLDREIYDLIDVNSLLFEYGQPLLP